MNEIAFQIVTGYPIDYFERENKKLTQDEIQKIESLTIMNDNLPDDMDRYEKIRYLTRSFWKAEISL